MPPRTRRRRGWIEQLPSGSHRAWVYAGTDPLTGRPRRLRETVGTYAEAEKALTRLQRQVDEDQHPKSEITVRRAVEQWTGCRPGPGPGRARMDRLEAHLRAHPDDPE